MRWERKTPFPPAIMQTRPKRGSSPEEKSPPDGTLLSAAVAMHTGPAAKEAAGMPGRKTKKGKSRCTRTVLRIPDLEQSKTAVLNSLPAKTSQESYAHAIDEFIAWYCSEPRLAFNRPVVLRYRIYLEQKNLASSQVLRGSVSSKTASSESAESEFTFPPRAKPVCVRPPHEYLPARRA